MGPGYYDDWDEDRFGDSPYQRSLSRQSRIVDRGLAHMNGYTYREQAPPFPASPLSLLSE